MARRFGEMLETARKTKKITLRKLGQLVGLSPSFLSEIENGRRLPPRNENKVHDLAIVLNIDKEEFAEAAQRERIKKNPKLFERLFSADQDLAWGLYREAEDATDDDLQRIFKRALKDLEKQRKGGKN
jgi:transcriptional regulator with XRE-family HTH domain